MFRPTKQKCTARRDKNNDIFYLQFIYLKKQPLYKAKFLKRLEGLNPPQLCNKLTPFLEIRHELKTFTYSALQVWHICNPSSEYLQWCHYSSERGAGVPR
jgi:hypothetical protein